MNGATTVLLALGPAIITGVVGYSGAKLQATVSVRAVEAENERLRRAHREDERRRLLGGYHDFLTAMYRLDAMMAGFAQLSKQEFDHWIEEFQQLYGGIDLTGSSAVRQAIAEVKTALDAIGMQARQRSGHRPFERDFAEAYRAGRERLIATVETAIDAMRTDVTLIGTDELDPATRGHETESAKETGSRYGLEGYDP